MNNATYHPLQKNQPEIPLKYHWMVFGSNLANGILNGILNGIPVNGLSMIFGSITANGIPFNGIPINGIW